MSFSPGFEGLLDRQLKCLGAILGLLGATLGLLGAILGLLGPSWRHLEPISCNLKAIVGYLTAKVPSNSKTYCFP